MDTPDHVATHLARNLASLRHARTLTQEALARAAEVPRSTIANLESGGGNPSLTVLVKVANALAVPIDELLAAPRAKVRKWPAADITKSVKGRGVSFMEDVAKWHHGVPSDDEYARAMAELDAALAKAEGALK
jgi:transcriptional regulator with XRE-family HTH domain